jgi:elongation factor Tu
MPTDPTFRMPIIDIFSIKGRGTVVIGRIEAGTVRVGDVVEIDGQVGIRITTVVVSLEGFRQVLTEAKAGDDVGVTLRGVESDDVQPGNVLVGRGTTLGIEFTWKP